MIIEYVECGVHTCNKTLCDICGCHEECTACNDFVCRPMNKMCH